MAKLLHSAGIQLGLKIVLVFSFALWAVSFGGLISATNMCRKGELSPAHSTFNYRNQARQTIIAGHLQPFPDVAYPFNKQLALSCGIHFSFEFWTAAFHLFCVAYAFLATTRHFFHNKFMVSLLWAISTVQYTIFTSIYAKLSFNFNGGEVDGDKAAAACNVALAGGVGVCVINFIFIAMFGTDEGEDGVPEEYKAVEQDD